MYYRRKVLIALLQKFGGSLANDVWQPLLFLFAEAQKTGAKSFEFIPYLRGCYSHQAEWDLGALEHHKLAHLDRETNVWICDAAENYIAQLKPDDQNILSEIKNNFSQKTADELDTHLDTNFPYYSIYKKGIANAPHKINDDFILYTIGYEGISFEKYINKLIQADINVLCDVRRNPFSQKFGFSKSHLKTICEAIGIRYVHIPELGIESEARQNLNSQADYDALFEQYEQKTLPNVSTQIEQLIDLIKTHKRVAITCFEAHPCQCHRGRLATHLSQRPDIFWELRHL